MRTANQSTALLTFTARIRDAGMGLGGGRARVALRYRDLSDRGTFNPVAAWRRCDRYIALVRRLTSNPTAYDKFEALVASYARHSEKRLPTRTPSVRRALDLS